MKRCPECRRDYYDDSLLYCLDDGSALLEGPASGDDAATAILRNVDLTKRIGTWAQTKLVYAAPVPSPDGRRHLVANGALSRSRTVRRY